MSILTAYRVEGLLTGVQPREEAPRDSLLHTTEYTGHKHVPNSKSRKSSSAKTPPKRASDKCSSEYRAAPDMAMTGLGR